MDFRYYIGFFHDGDFLNVCHDGNHVEIELASSVLIPEWNKKAIQLDERGRIHGFLVLDDVQWIKVNNQHFDGLITKQTPYGEVLDFEVRKTFIELGVLWHDHPNPLDRYHFIEIGANSIVWQDDLNGITINLTGLYTGKTKKD